MRALIGSVVSIARVKMLICTSSDMEGGERFAYVLTNMESPQEKADLPDDSLVLKLPDESSSLRDVLAMGGDVGALALIAFWPATEGQYIWMDGWNLQPTDLSTVWNGRWKDAQHYPMLQYHPVTFTTHWIEGHLVGRDATCAPPAFPFHLVNILLHCGAAVLAWLILRKLKLPGAWMAAAPFALHPINAETVSWISQRSSVLAGMLVLGSVYSYLFFADDDVAIAPDQRWSLYGLSLVLFVLAMLSKSTAWAMPVCMLLLLWWQRRISLRHATPPFPFLMIGVVLGLAAADFERVVQRAVGPEWDRGSAQRVILAGQTLIFYLTKLIASVRLSALYGRWPISVVSLWPLLLVAGGLAAAVWRFGRGPIVAGGVSLLFVAGDGIFQSGSDALYSFVADHNAYLAVLPFVALVVAGATQLLRVAMRGTSYGGTVVGLSAVLLVAAGSMTWAPHAGLSEFRRVVAGCGGESSQLIFLRGLDCRRRCVTRRMWIWRGGIRNRRIRIWCRLWSSGGPGGGAESSRCFDSTDLGRDSSAAEGFSGSCRSSETGDAD